MKEICKVSKYKYNNNILLHIQNAIEDALIFNDCSKTSKVNKAIEYLQKSNSNYTSENIVDNIIESSARNKKQCPDSITKLILDNKFLDINWEIIFDDSSDKTPNMSQLKILVKISYLNLSLMKKEELNLLLNENEFNKLLLEFEALQKGFQTLNTYILYFIINKI